MNTDGLISVGERIEHARILYDRALLNGDPGALEEADGGRSASCPAWPGTWSGSPTSLPVRVAATTRWR
jgi:hypothetical protein